MTSRSKNAVRSYETEIEKCREDSNWKKAVELAQQLKARSPQHESLAHFLIGEGKLEAHLDEWPPIKDNITRAQHELSDARGYLTLATDESGKKAGVALDAHLLLGKLEYACGAYEDALKHYRLAELSTLTEKELPIRSLRIVAESYAIKGLCLEETESSSGSTSRYKQAERDAEMVGSLETSSRLCVLYLQRVSAAARAGPALDAALHRPPALHLKAGRPLQALYRYRELLSAVESQWTQSLRLTVARQLAELLMRGQVGAAYTPPEKPTPVGSLTRRREDHSADGPWKPKKYNSINQFVPQNVLEECVLVVVVCEALAARDAVLSQSPEFEAARAHALDHAVAVNDLLALLTTRWRQRALLIESLERAMKFSFGCAHIWRQRALATAAAAADQHEEGCSSAVVSVSVCGRAKALCPRDAALRLVGAATAYRAGEIDEGIKLSEEALSIEEERSGPLLARSHLYAGIGYQMKAQKSNCRLVKESSTAKCVSLLRRSVQLDDNDHLAYYHLALQHLHDGALADAMECSRRCLSRRWWCAGGLRVAALAWARVGPAAGRGGGLAAARLAAHHHPHAPAHRHHLAYMQLLCDEEEAALATGKELLSMLTAAGELEHTGYTELDAFSDSQHDDITSNRDAASVRALSLSGAPSLPRALSVTSSGDGAHDAHRKARAWVLLAEICIRLNKLSTAAGCVAEATALTPSSHAVIYTRGLVHEANGEWEEARECFINAAALAPHHVDTLLHLGSAYYETGWTRLAEGSLRAAAGLAPGRADVWRRLALVLGARGDHAAAADAAAAAVHLPHYAQPTLY